MTRVGCSFLHPQGFGLEAKTGEGTLGSPACIPTGYFKKVRNVLVHTMVGSMGSFLDLVKLGAHGGLG